MATSRAERQREYQRRYRQRNLEKVREADRKYQQEHPEKKREWRKKNPKLNAYYQHKSTAKARGIEFLFTFEEWRAMWEPYWENRGLGSDEFCMCRNGDIGPYSPENCRIDTHRNNKKEYRESKSKEEENDK